jgi:yecA family protein
MTLEGVDGLFCALIASPRTVLPNEYLSTIFGADANAFADIEAANATMSLLMRYWNSIIADLEQEGDLFMIPLMAGEWIRIGPRSR